MRLRHGRKLKAGLPQPALAPSHLLHLHPRSPPSMSLGVVLLRHLLRLVLSRRLPRQPRPRTCLPCLTNSTKENRSPPVSAR